MTNHAERAAPVVNLNVKLKCQDQVYVIIVMQIYMLKEL